jgi:hypothetical protein
MSKRMAWLSACRRLLCWIGAALASVLLLFSIPDQRIEFIRYAGAVAEGAPSLDCSGDPQIEAELPCAESTQEGSVAPPTEVFPVESPPTESPSEAVPAPGIDIAGPALEARGLELTATFNSVGVEVAFGGDANGNASAALAFRVAGAGTGSGTGAGEMGWREGLPLWRTDDGSVAPGAAFYGSALLLEAGTAYEVRVTLADPDGVAGAVVLSGTVTTRAEDIPAAGALAPTHYVRADGSDASAGTSAGAAWRTLQKAVAAAPAGAVVQVGPGAFAAPTGVRTAPLTLVAQYAAVDDARAVANAGRHSRIDFGRETARGSGAWQRVTLTGPGYAGAPAGAAYTVWKWGPVAGGEPAVLAYAASPDEVPQRLASWDHKGTHLATPAGWAEKLYTNRSYNYGWTAFRNADGTHDVYLRMPFDRDPNAYYVSAGGVDRGGAADDALLALDGPDLRVSGFRLRGGYVRIGANARRVTLDHNLFELDGVRVYGKAPGTYGSDHVIERNRFVSTGLWSDDQAANPSIPWPFMKENITNADGTTYGSNRLGAGSTVTAVFNLGGARRTVIRHNTIDGYFNAVTSYAPDFDRYAMVDNDVHGNVMRRIADDALEPSYNVINWRVWDNRVEEATVFLSPGPTRYGPLYLFRNEAWRVGTRGLAPTAEGDYGASGKGIKYSGSSTPAARVYLLHNTLWTDDPGNGGVGISGGEQSAGGGASPEAFYLRNNVLRFTRSGFGAPGAPGRWDEDHNHFASANTSRGLQYGGTTFTTDVAGYRAKSGQGQHTNLAGSFVAAAAADGALAAPAAGDLRLRPGAPFVDAGARVPNLSDRPGVDFAGSAPDLGSRETVR